MDKPIHEEKYRDLIIKIYGDNNPLNPRKDWDNFGHMICFHRKYNLGDKHNMSMEELQELVERKDVVALPLYLYDHSGITMNTTGFSCPWDSGQIGYIYTDEAKIRQEYNLLDPSKKIHKHIKDKARALLESEVETYNDYLTGNVWGFVVEDNEGEHIDSCWGFYGDYEKGALKEAKDVVAYLTNRGKTNAIGQYLNPGIA